MAWKTRTLTSHDLSLARQSLASLAKKYVTGSDDVAANRAASAEIAAQNGVPWSTPAVNRWVKATGGREVTPGNWAFLPGNKIKLPEKALIPEPAPVLASQMVEGGIPWWGWAALAGGGVLLLRKKRKGKRS